MQIARTERALGSEPIISHQVVGYSLADIKTRIEAARYLTWKSCHHLDQTEGTEEELAIMTKVFASEAAVQCVYDAMQVVGVNSYAKDRTTLERLMRDVLVLPIFDGGNMGVRRRQLHNILMQPGYDPMLAAEGRRSA
ncbi:hypothetical protein PA7_45220 [Pseudonocardia asaccharolytica DSM 44247 = NBRC 16224]|uniref:Acyl-CoA dehydrogenase/oxidase C-terminal domain-containing protein n=2 Tax=Pseudonocardia asaccharolytica TaxID=54010 RepID=A0A511D795_9PSEU|nr:hypothetical protein PA7_45220 [Pseudonocardia asaccharolytica DSM 44247 = NBRC 16224]